MFKDPDQTIQILVLKEVHTPNGLNSFWEPHERLPEASIRILFTRYLDITTPPTSNFLLLLAQYTQHKEQKEKLENLAKKDELGFIRT
ncbi:Nitric oxide synthase, salivary gland [Armadillidium nasatum]|uniref:nitric-oxide synthase (NADPH) n=1 Tax=Armadillidium nasatum TaxID=96803 RepID=A0A5N5T940_9CRUS|nr:Nitric oxide synthase, salivary gland [Armadillidium nasatum]